MPPVICPDRDTLGRLLLGELQEVESTGVIAHLENCASCLAALRQFEASDPLVSLLRENPGAVAERDESDPLAEQLIGRMLALNAETMASADTRASRVLAATVEPGGQRHLGDYELLERIGQGGMGVVYRARHRRLNRVVALKMIRSGELADESAVRRFQAEAEAAAQLDHPGIVPVYEVGEHDGQHYMAMAYVAGVSLWQRIKEFPLAPREAARLTQQVAQAVQYAHDRGIIHRDIKPHNILLPVTDGLAAGQKNSGSDRTTTADGSSPIDPRRDEVLPRVTDFGLAKRQSAESGLTATGQILGTPSYMPPEQATGDGDNIGPAADIYALGATLYCLLTGRPPFQAATQFETLRQVLGQDPVSPRALNPAVDRDLETITLKCLEKDPRRRYATATDLADDLGRFLSHAPVRARPLGPAGRAWRWSRRHRAASTAGAIALLAIVAAAAWIQTRPAYLELRVTPGNALVTLDGQRVALDAGQALVPSGPGRHELEIKAEGYVPQSQSLILARGRNNAAMVNVELQSQFGYLQVDGTPAGAVIEVLDPRGPVAARGLLPFHSPRLPAGEYLVRVIEQLHEPIELIAVVPPADRLAIAGPVTLKASSQGGQMLQQLEQVASRMAQPIARPWEFERTPLEEVLAFVQETEQVDTTLDVQALDDEGLPTDAPISLRLSAVSLGTALELALSQLRLAYVPILEGDRLTLQVTTREGSSDKLQTIVYPVANLWATTGNRDWDNLIEVIANSIRPTSWNEVGGPGSMTPLDDQDALSVSQTWQAHLELHRLLADLRRTAAQKRSADESAGTNAQALTASASLASLRQFREVLDRPITPAWKFEQQSLESVLAFLGAMERLQILLDTNSLRDEGIDPAATRITLQREQGSFGAALSDILRPLKLTFVPYGEGQVLLVTTRRAAQNHFERIVYPITEFPKINGTPATPDQLIRAITSQIAPTGWDAVGGPGTIAWFAERKVLVVSQSWNVQDEIDRLLIRLRDGGADTEALVAVSADTPSRAVVAAAPPAPASPVERRLDYDRLAADIEAGTPANPADPRTIELRQRLTDFRARHPGTPEAYSAVGLLARLTWPIDGLAPDQVSAYELAASGGGQPERAPAGLVAVIGDSRLMHWGKVACVAYSPDGAVLASGGSDQKVRLWDAQSGELRQELAGHQGEITAIAFGHDSQWLATAGQDHAIRLWDARTGELRSTLRGHIAPVRGLAFSPVGSMLASAGQDLKVKLWDVSLGAETGELLGHANAVLAVAFHPDGQRLATCGEDRTVRLWDLTAQLALHQWTMSGPVRGVAFNADGSIVAAVCDGPPVNLALNSPAAPREPVKSWEVATGQPLAVIKSALNVSFSLTSIAFHPDGQTLALSSPDFGPFLHDLRSPNLMPPVRHVSGAPVASSHAVAFSPDGHKLACATATGAVEMLNVLEPTAGQPRRLAAAAVRDPGRSLRSVAFSPDGAWLVTADESRLLHSWSIAARKFSPQPRELIPGVSSEWRRMPFQVAFHPANSLLAIPGMNGAAQLWNAEQPGRLVDVGRGGQGRQIYYSASGQPISFSPDGLALAVVQGRNTVRILSATLGEELSKLTFSGELKCLSFSPDARSLATGYADGTIRLWDPHAGHSARTWPAHGAAVVCLAFSANGRVLASGNANDGRLALWDASTAQPLHVATSPAPVSSLACSPVRSLLASLHADGMLRLWEIPSAKLLREIALGPPSGEIWQVVFSPEGRHLATANGNGTAYILRLAELLPDTLEANGPPAAAEQSAALPADGREPALRVLSLGGRVEVSQYGKTIEATNPQDVPSGPIALVGVNLSGQPNLRGDDIAFLRDAAGLRKAWFERTPALEGAALAHLAGCRWLTALALGGNTQIHGADLRPFSELWSLQSLFLAGSGFDDEGCSIVGTLPNLRLLDIAATQVTDDGLARLKDLRLHDLCLNGTTISDAGLEHLRTQSRLGVLRLSGTRITDQGLVAIADLPTLHTLDLARTAVTDAGFDHVARLMAVTSLDLSQTSVSDAGLQRLAELPKLTNLKLSSAPVSAAAIDALRQSLPMCQIQFTSP